jgi:hypothetical protein
VRVPAYRPAEPAKRAGGVGRWLALLAVAGVVGASVAPQTRPTVRRIAEVGIERVKVALGVHTSAPATPVAGDSATMLAAGPDLAAVDPVVAPPESAGLDGAAASGAALDTAPRLPVAPLERPPIGIDTTNYGAAPTPFRRPDAPEWGYIKVMVYNGVGEAIIDGEKVGWAPLVARVAPGKHTIRVSGAGDLFAPSQINATVVVNDTFPAVFSAPSSAPPPAADEGAPPPAPASAPADSAAADSVSPGAPRRR